jgi:cytochrome P450
MSKLGVALETFSYLADPIGWFDRAAARLGPVFRAETLPYGRETFVAEPAIAREIFASRDMLGGRANVALRHVVGNDSVSSLDGAAHAERRRQLVAVLAAGRARSGPEAARAIAMRELGLVARGGRTSLVPLLRRVVMASMLEAMFDVVTPAVRELGATFTQLVDRGALPFAQLGVMPGLRRDFPGSPWRTFSRVLADVDARLRVEVALTRGPGGMLGALQAVRDASGAPLGNHVLRDEVLTLLGAGYETTVTSIAWALEAILLHPEIARSIAAGDEALLDAAIKESLRLRPTLPTVRRVAVAPFDAGGIPVAPNDSVVLAIHLLQRTGLADASRFDPRRGDGARAFFAFGGGARTCPGMALALEQMRGVLSALVPELSLERARPSRPIFRGATLAPARPVVVRRVGACPVMR